MGNRFITTLENNIVYCALLDQKDQMIELHPEQINDHSIIGNIYIGKVSNVVKGINATFVNIGLEKDVFLQIEEGQHFIYTNNKPTLDSPKVGDELLIQITKDYYMSKAATATSMINLTGRYSVLTYKKNFVGISSKVKKVQERYRLKEIYSNAINDDYGFIIRTNAVDVAEEDLIKERDMLIAIFNRLLEVGKFRKSYQCVYKEPENYIRLIRDLYKNNVDVYLFDDEAIYNSAKDYFNDDYYNNISERFELRTDASCNLYQLLGFHSKIEKALQEKVWLNSGANLFIQPTEALIVIDVNTSKSVGKKNFEETVFAINLESAKEISRQIRLRNLSGIIIIDFIDMQDEEHKTQLLTLLESLFLEDRIKTTLVDMTPLGLVEVTRKKVDKNIYDKFKNLKFPSL
ncbi:MAG: ribonuclease E/G [Firmicutes bacterium HGW-Firmicutes-1]|jgi:ribonuclease G|nr:MAG: ribonuclease E/G [Firmicutes bacterium HGW-Firmicutes-1]